MPSLLRGSRATTLRAAALALVLVATVCASGTAADSHYGDMLAYGRNDVGQLGVEASSGSDAANPKPTEIALSSGVARMAVGASTASP